MKIRRFMTASPYLRNRDLNGVFVCRLNGDLSHWVRGGEFLVTVSAKSTVLNWDMFRSYVSVRNKRVFNKAKKGLIIVETLLKVNK